MGVVVMVMVVLGVWCRTHVRGARPFAPCPIAPWLVVFGVGCFGLGPVGAVPRRCLCHIVRGWWGSSVGLVVGGCLGWSSPAAVRRVFAVWVYGGGAFTRP